MYTFFPTGKLPGGHVHTSFSFKFPIFTRTFSFAIFHCLRYDIYTLYLHTINNSDKNNIIKIGIF